MLNKKIESREDVKEIMRNWGLMEYVTLPISVNGNIVEGESLKHLTGKVDIRHPFLDEYHACRYGRGWAKEPELIEDVEEFLWRFKDSWNQKLEMDGVMY